MVALVDDVLPSEQLKTRTFFKLLLIFSIKRWILCCYQSLDILNRTVISSFQ